MLFTFRMVPALAGMYIQRGLDPAALVREVGLPSEALSGEVTAPLDRIQALLDRAAKQLERPLVGLDLVAAVQPGTFGLAEFVGRFAPTVRHGFEVFCASAALVNPLIDWRYQASKTEHAMQLTTTVPGGLGAQLAEYSVAVVIHLAHEGLAPPLRVSRVWFSHRERAGVAARFTAPVTFGQATCGFAFAPSEADRAPKMADAALFAFHLAQAKARLATLGGDDVVAHVTRVIELRSAQGDLSIEAIARALATTERTLQRRLTAAGTSFRAVVVHVRRRRRAELERDGIPEAKIAELLGFPDVRAMRRSLA